MRLVLVVCFALSLIALNAAESSRQWQRFKNAHGCEIVPRSGSKPRSYVCRGEPCKGPEDCYTTLGDSSHD